MRNVGIDQHRPKFGRNWPTLIEFGPKLDSRSNCSTTVRQLFGNFWATAKLAGITGGAFRERVPRAEQLFGNVRATLCFLPSSASPMGAVTPLELPPQTHPRHRPNPSSEVARASVPLIGMRRSNIGAAGDSVRKSMPALPSIAKEGTAEEEGPAQTHGPFWGPSIVPNVVK